MMKAQRSIIGLSLLFAALCAVAGCGSSGNKEGSASLATVPRIGSEACTNTCHAATTDISGTAIAAAWAATTHTTSGHVQCEDCHGGGSTHWGFGPIPFPNPQAAQCNVCHDKTGFDGTAHANAHAAGGFAGPDAFFFQGAADTAQARNAFDTSGTAPLEFLPDGVTPVSRAQHIQECSVCHNPPQRFDFNRDGTLAKPEPGNMPNPVVSCASCHDAHQAEQKVTIAQRSAPVAYPVFRAFIVNPTGEQSFLADFSTGNETPTGTSVRLAASFYQPNGSVNADGTVDITKVVGTNNELNIERLCASCHTVGAYLFSQAATHQNDTYTQWTNSGHGTRNDPAFAEFSANPPAYTNPNTGLPYTLAGSHQTSYPFDMALNSAGATATTTRNAGNNNLACFKCHNGRGSIAWQENVQATSAASVVFGDEPVTCITCHDPHQDYPGQSKNVRKPVVITNYSSSSLTFQGNVFLDNTAVPLDKTGNGTICVFCHQGRESGLTLYATKLAPGKTITGSFFNPHYLGTGAMLWGVNAYEYAGKSYSANTAHQDANCPTCHMANPTADAQNGGHTWNPNVATCNTASCHGAIGTLGVEAGTQNPDVDTYRASSDTNNYTGDQGGESLSIADSIGGLQQKLIAVFATRGIEYDDLNYPYFFQGGLPHTSANAFTAWTPPLYKAAFNLSFVVKGLPSGATSQADVPNASAAVHNHKYIIQILLDSYQDLTGAALAGATRPAGTRPATVYGANQ